MVEGRIANFGISLDVFEFLRLDDFFRFLKNQVFGYSWSTRKPRFPMDKRPLVEGRVTNFCIFLDAIPRQMNITKSPFMCASDCPAGKKKSILDAKDGDHSVVLEKGESRAVTEFLCEFGRYRCIGSGSSYKCLYS